MKRLHIFLIIIVFFLSNSCDNSLEVNVPWKDISVVYCILNPDENVHYVRLNKCFLGDGNVYDMAQISDSIYYTDANVSLIAGKIVSDSKFEEDKNIPVIILEKTSIIPKDSGLFSTANIFYKTAGNNTILNQRKDYKLLIEIPGKKTIEAYTSLIPITDLKLDKPDKIKLSLSDTLEYEWKSVETATFYESRILFVYTEIYNNIATTKTITLKQISQSTRFENGGETMTMDITGKKFLEYISAVIKGASDYNPDAVRVANSYVPLPNDINNSRNRYPIKLYLNVCARELNDYVNISQAAGSIQTEMSYFSNIPDNIGILSCRAYKVFVKQATDKTINDLSKSYITKDLNFMDIYQTAAYWSHNE